MVVFAPCKKKQADETVAVLVNTAHYYMECSNKGLCDRLAGTCVCFIGYEGHSCERASCPNGCSGHGVCKTTRELADDHFANVYELWDADKVTQFPVLGNLVRAEMGRVTS